MLAVVISEFVASNTNSFEDGFGSKPDWIELYNNGSTAVDLNGYSLTDDADDSTAWTFAGQTILNANDYLVVFASGNDLIDPAGFHHTNFKLSAGGEYLGLHDASGTLLSSFGDNGVDYPPQITDVSYGLPGGTLLNGESSSFFLEPSNNSVDNTWRSLNFNAQTNGFLVGTSAIGYENSPGSTTSFENKFTTEISSGETSVYLRTEFTISDASAVTDLLLELKYDDGFAAYLNGTLVAQQNAPANLAFNSVATGIHEDSQALQFDPFSLNNRVNLLQDGTNVLAIHALNQSGSSDFLLVPRLTSNVSSGNADYLSSTTPGFANGEPISLGPEIESVTPNGVAVNANQSLVLSVRVSEFTRPVDSNSVRLIYRQNFGNEIPLFPNDSGIAGDAVAGDGIYSTTVNNVGTAGSLFRWYFTASDIDGNETRAPLFNDPLNSAQYFGTVVNDPSLTTDLPVFEWFVQNTTGTFTDAGARGSLFFNGEFYDNIDTNAHGQSTRGGEFPKKSFDFDSNSGEKFLISDEVGRASDFNLLTNYADQT
ncbi:lamin tail domain-containing protein, partial [bacterium]|nr:lamin tail domain-containing protein [bacterium]